MSYKWIIFFSSIPSKPVANRMRVWRRLTRAGAIQLKGSVYVLPAGKEHEELLHWLVAEVEGMGGAAAFAVAERIPTIADSVIVGRFNLRKEGEYQAIGEALGGLELSIESLRQGGDRLPRKRGPEARIERLRRAFEEARRTDFFSCAAGEALAERFERARAVLEAPPGPAAGGPPEIRPRARSAYQGRRWVTRADPFVDRMASAWLIRRFVDADAVFAFLPPEEALTDPAAVTFDMAGGEFAHAGPLCTFEVLLRAFALRADPALARIARVVHDLDVAGEPDPPPEAAGVGEILAGIRRTAREDAEALERGMAVFEALYAARSRRG